MRRSVIPFVSFGVSLVSALRYHGADFSSLLLLESTANIHYAPSSTAASQPFEKILYDSGVNLARIRLWTAGTYNLNYSLEVAKRAKAAGMDLMIDLHYNDIWADAGHQAIPSGWPTDLEGLVSQVYNYTYAVMEAFNASKTPIQFIQIGNEINDGLLWPTGRISVNGFTGVSKLLYAGALAVRKASPSTKTLIHLTNGWDKVGISYFYSGIFGVGETAKGQGGFLTLSDVDVMGFTFYPFYGTAATFENLNSSMNHTVSTYKKDIMIVETNWPAVCDTQAAPLSEPTIPVSVEGQITWTKDIVTVLNKVNLDYHNKSLGIIYWEPGWIGNPALGSFCADNLLVTNEGVIRPSIALFRDT